MTLINEADWVLALGFAPLMSYVLVYLVLRVCGTLSVNARGWHAGSVSMGRRVVLSALRLFGFFQPLLRLESGIARRLVRLRGLPRDQGVSEVVVELVPLG